MTCFDFTRMVNEEMDQLPSYVFQDLSGGVLVEETAYPHPGRVSDDLYILGTYSTGGLVGKQIRIYYGSFCAVMDMTDENAVREQIRATLRHEFLHHMETRAGLFGKGTLIEEDEERMKRYYMKHKK